MSWTDRIKIDNPTSSEVDSLIRSADTVFILNDPGPMNDRELGGPLKFSKLVGIGAVEEFTSFSDNWRSELKDWLSAQNDLVLGYLSYDIKNRLENLSSINPQRIGFPQLRFVVPETVVLWTGETCSSLSHSQQPFAKSQNSMVIQKWVGSDSLSFDRSGYCNTVDTLKDHIQQGDIYEVNYCIEHHFEDTRIDPFQLYQELQHNSPAPFSCYVADHGNYLMSSSPERFMMKKENRIFSQPMKGTNRRTQHNEEQKKLLRNDSKEVSENVMITDLVRNDLSRSAVKGSVKVDELCGVYEFEHVNTMISTVSAELRDDVHPLDALLNAFPMGSMTGAPKIRAMKLIDEFEDFSRGLYSGTVGYFTPDLDFDFNVVIRSILYNKDRKIVTFPTGGAITINSDPDKEYEECLLKAEAMRKVLLNHAK
jgi:para-aminobenzoate synthetase component 1